MGEGQFQEDREGLSEKIAFVLRPEWSKVPGHGKIRSKSILGRVSGKEYSSEAGRNSVSLRKKGQGRLVSHALLSRCIPKAHSSSISVILSPRGGCCWWTK